MLALVGCRSPNLVDPPKPKEPGVDRTVYTGSGEATQRADDKARERRWTVNWDSAQIDVDADGGIGGSMEGVRGVLYQGDLPSSDFTAKAAVADRDTGVLTLSGDVRVVRRVEAPNGKGASPEDEAARLECDALEWHSDRDLLMAKGRVRVETDSWLMGPTDELWTNAKLTRVGTPDRFGVK